MTTTWRSKHHSAAWPVLVAVLPALAGCAGHASTSSAPTSAVEAPTAEPTGTPTSTSAATAGLVAVIVMENHSPDQVLGQPYLSSLAAQGAVLRNYRAVSHPSLPNYLALTSGNTWGINDDGYHQLPGGRDLGAQLSSAGIPWRAYMEGLSGGCFNSPYPYALKHNPFAYYGGSCPPGVVPFSNLVTDIRSASPPRFVWITPNLCSDDHDCSPSTGDQWLGSVVPQLLASPGFARHGLVAVVWDEGGDNYDLSAAVILSPDLHAHDSSARYDHYSLLAAVEDRLGLARLGAAAGTDPLTAVLTPA